jgi:LemA protein
MGEIVGFVGAIVKLVIFAALVLAALALWGYNKLRRLSENVKEARSNIKVAVGRKTQLVNDLTALVLRYHQDEQLVMLKVSEDTTVASLQSMYQQAGTVLSTIQGMAQRYPELKSNAQFGQLMAAISECENNIQSVRMLYNATTKEYNVMRGSFPHLFYAGLLGFNAGKYIDFDEMHPGAGAGDGGVAISDDGERMRQLMGLASTKALEATKSLAQQGRLLAEKAAARAQSSAGALGDGRETPRQPVDTGESTARPDADASS